VSDSVPSELRHPTEGGAEEARRRLGAAKAEIDRLRARLERVEEENRAFVSSMRHMSAAAHEILEEARQEASATRARAAAEAYERLVVARADARAAVHEERQRVARELEMLAAVRERIAEERASLTHFHDQLRGRLRHLMRAMIEFADRSPMIESADRSPMIESAGAVPAGEVVEAGASVLDGDVIEAVSPEPVPVDSPDDEVACGPQVVTDLAEQADDDLEEAFAAFFSNDVETEPSRSWILNES
jgi:hypothetical protein